MKTFLTWLENEETPGLSEPQHKKGEDTQELDKTVEQRIRAMIQELEKDGKGSEKKILASMVKYAEKMGVKGSSQEAQQSQNQQQVQQSQNQQQVQQPQTQQPGAADQMGMPQVQGVV